MTYVLFSQIVEENGKTIRENRMQIPHNIPIGTLVEVKYDEWHGGGACERVHARLWVVSHDRDCDGSPLYSLSPKKLENHLQAQSSLIQGLINDIRHGYGEESLVPVVVTADLEYGHGALTWDDDA